MTTEYDVEDLYDDYCIQRAASRLLTVEESTTTTTLLRLQYIVQSDI